MYIDGTDYLLYCEDDGYWVYRLDHGRQAGPFTNEEDARRWVADRFQAN